MNLKTAYQTNRQKHRTSIDSIRSEILYKCFVIVEEIQTDIKDLPHQISNRQSQISTKAQRLKDRIDTAVCDVTRKCRVLLMDRIQQQKRKMNRHLRHIQNYVERYEQSVSQPVQFIVFINTSRAPKIKDTPNLPQHLLLSLTEGFNMEDVGQLLRGIPEIQISTRKRKTGIHKYLKLMSTPVQFASVSVPGISRVLHISNVTSDQFYVSNRNHVILTDKRGLSLYRVKETKALYGTHTVNGFGELIYIGSDESINKLSVNNGIVKLLGSTSPWRPQCVYCSPETGDVIVGMYNPDENTGTVSRYDNTGKKHILTNEDGSKRHTEYGLPDYITENRNGDIIVSDIYRNAVVVTDRLGKHRFSYKGLPSGPTISPRGLCTDVLSHILVCDYDTETVQIIDKDGHFLRVLLSKDYGIDCPYSLSFDFKNHLLWLGSRDNSTVSAFTYIQRKCIMFRKSCRNCTNESCLYIRDESEYH
jgi:hypothetical protein